MNDISVERPDFFEGQYLGAADLEQLVSYVRDVHARHGLAGHVWGIASGLQLVEQKTPSGELEVYLLPGYAVDGYGRAVVVINPCRLTADLMTGQASGGVPLWVRYDEGRRKGVRRGFETCVAGDQYARVAEGFTLEAGFRPAVTDRESGVSVAGEAIDDAREMARVFDEQGPLACDGSAPFQELPRPTDADRWLIPLGLVGWQAGAPGKFAALSDADKLVARRLRRYHGVVAESLLAPGGVIRLRDRYHPFTAGQDVETQCAEDAIQESDLRTCGGRPEFNELVWLEGRVRIKGDTRLHAARLEFRDAKGTGYAAAGGKPASTPLLLQRNEQNERLGQDLQVLIGPSSDGRNRLAIGQATPVEDPKSCALSFNVTNRVIVQDDGKVGVGTNAPDRLVTLEAAAAVYLNARTTQGPHEVLVGADVNGAIVSAMTNDDLQLRAGTNSTKVTIKKTGEVGIGTTTPQAKLDIAAVRAASGGSSLGEDLWLRAGDGDDSGRFWVEYGSQAAPLLVLSDQDDPPRMQFQQSGSGQENNPQHRSWIGHARGSSPDLAAIGGNLGVGTTTPDRLVTLQGGDSAYLNVRTTVGPHEVLIGADGGGAIVSAMTNDDLQLRAGGNSTKVTIKTTGRVGIGTTAPAEVLDVRGHVKLGTSGDLFAPGSMQNMRFIAGAVTLNGVRSAGAGFTAQRLSLGLYQVRFDVAFPAAPVVVATPVNASGEDAILTLQSLSSVGFNVHFRDAVPDNEGTMQDAAFHFMVFGLRG